jgi:hypothetical protein
VYLYDASAINVRDRRVLLEDRLRRGGVLDEWEVRATPSRNALLVSLCADEPQRPARTSVTQGDEPCPVPTGMDVVGGERVLFPKPRREPAQRYDTPGSWAKHAVSGVFSAVAEPELVAETLCDVFSCARRAHPHR